MTPVGYEGHLAEIQVLTEDKNHKVKLCDLIPRSTHPRILSNINSTVCSSDLCEMPPKRANKGDGVDEGVKGAKKGGL